MANYPTFGQLVGATEDADDDVVIDRATDGTGYGRSFYTAEKRRFAFGHVFQTAADLATFEAFYTANRTIPFTFVFEGRDGASYTCLFEGKPKYTFLGRNLVRADVRLAVI